MIVIAVGDDNSVLDMCFGLSEVLMGVCFIFKTKDRDRQDECGRKYMHFQNFVQLLAPISLSSFLISAISVLDYSLC
jgi:hypothetical protein